MNTVNETCTVRRTTARNPSSSVPNPYSAPANSAVSSAASTKNTLQPFTRLTFPKIEHCAVRERVLGHEPPEVARGVGGIAQRACAMQLAEPLDDRECLLRHRADLLLHRGRNHAGRHRQHAAAPSAALLFGAR